MQAVTRGTGYRESGGVYDDMKANFGMIPNFFKAQAAVDPEWAELNWFRVKRIMLGRVVWTARQRR
ncbi:MAG: hypothetical protein ACP5SG_00800 [Dissulfurimicrobium sp.]|jgi:hypothetical protein|uniref:hypothetical protein n=1 Tax=Dissulfurimicrobium TaxID=1769732 RepID=UPI001EDC260D|nr:hypothetical protein [Dissulfurimicrobium hydrothermale]UKL13685.1 hypothetical protein LGS26_09530 [Dissulfurimicrobium hydrothermale]